jgi:16S rRNA C1402 (ribose-2'-O) methylase RsmI
MVGTGRKGNRVFASPSDSQASIVSSGMLAKAKNGVSVLAGPTATVSAAGTPAASDPGYWESEAESITLTGINVTAANATALGDFAAGFRVDAHGFRSRMASPRKLEKLAL